MPLRGALRPTGALCPARHLARRRAVCGAGFAAGSHDGPGRERERRWALAKAARAEQGTAALSRRSACSGRRGRACARGTRLPRLTSPPPLPTPVASNTLQPWAAAATTAPWSNGSCWSRRLPRRSSGSSPSWTWSTTRMRSWRAASPTRRSRCLALSAALCFACPRPAAGSHSLRFCRQPRCVWSSPCCNRPGRLLPPALAPSCRPPSSPQPSPRLLALQPFWIAQAQAILFYRFSKTALLAGCASGDGILVTRCAAAVLCGHRRAGLLGSGSGAVAALHANGLTACGECGAAGTACRNCCAPCLS